MRRLLTVILLFAFLATGILGGIIGCGVSSGRSGERHSGMKMERDQAVAELANTQAPRSVFARLVGTFARDEELWVIERKREAAAQTGDDIPGTGSIVARLPNQQAPVPMPLKHTDVKASIAGFISTVDVTQQFANPFDTKIEAIYVFPLPSNAAVNEFVMQIGTRKIRGIIREKEEARRIYTQAKQQGHVATLLTQDRPNIFTQSVANIEPGKQIDVKIRYFHTLTYSDGWYEFVFPMVVGPRFNPPGTADGIGAAARGAAGLSGQTKEVQYLRPGERSGHDIALNLRLDAGVAVEEMQCNSHRVEITKVSRGAGAQVNLAPGDRIPNKDFVFRYRVAGKEPKGAVMAMRDSRRGGGFFAMMLFPPLTSEGLPLQPLELVFTLDTSGSMQGPPMEQSKAAIRHALRNMDASDTFRIVRFGDRAETMTTGALSATPDNVRRGLRFIDSMQSGGGTNLVDGLRTSLRFAHDESRTRYVAFLTDGYIGNEAEAIRDLAKDMGPARVFSFGVGSSPNRFLMDAMARTGNGAAAYLGLRDSGAEVMQAFLERVRRPALTDVEIDFGSLQVSDVFPRRIGDLHVGRPVVVCGRFNGEGGPTTLKVIGRVGGQRRVIEVPVRFDDSHAHHALPAVWARTKMAELMERAALTQDAALTPQIRQVALEFGLTSPFTSFVAVDGSGKTEGTFGVSVNVAVPAPEGTRYETAAPPPQQGAGVRE